MYDEVAMSIGHCGRNLEKQGDPAANGEAVRGRILLDGNAIDVFHHQIRRTAGGDATIEQARNVWVIEIGQNLAFVAEPGGDGFILEGTSDQLDRDLHTELPVVAAGEIDDSHSARAQARE